MDYELKSCIEFHIATYICGTVKYLLLTVLYVLIFRCVVSFQKFLNQGTSETIKLKGF